MFEVKVNGRGQITFPKSICEKYGLTKGVPLTVTEDDGKFIVKPLYRCSRCKKALVSGHLCENCPPPAMIEVY